MNRKQRKILVTGAAGFIGSHLVDDLLENGDFVVNLDNFNNFYDPEIKRDNIKEHLSHENYRLIDGDLRDKHKLEEAFSFGPFDAVVHLAAMAGVRPSIENPAYYTDVNVHGTQLLIDATIKGDAKRFIFASSSSVYGGRQGEQFLETDRVDRPLSPYAATKVAGEQLSYVAHHTTGLPVMCLRFFNSFGPRQRPDLALPKFYHLIESGQPIEVYGDGSTKRDYTFVRDTVYGIKQSMIVDFSGYEIINLGRGAPVNIMDMIKTIERVVGKKAQLVHKELHCADVPYTYASIDKARQILGYNPTISFEDGVREYINWYKKSAAARNNISSHAIRSTLA
jgi:UDP-glucuronate 4-epimerase